MDDEDQEQEEGVMSRTTLERETDQFESVVVCDPRTTQRTFQEFHRRLEKRDMAKPQEHLVKHTNQPARSTDCFKAGSG